jgi:uncharacterized protein YjiK
MKYFNFSVQIVWIVTMLSFVNMSCHPPPKILESPQYYNFSKPVTFKLDLKLREISGITWDTKKNLFIAISDAYGKLFYLDKDGRLNTDQPVFGDNGDYEDVALLNGVTYILRSDGMITKFIKDSTGKTYGVEAGKTGLSGTNDFETMYSDPLRKALVVICKNCKTDDDKLVSAFAFYPDSIGFDNKPLYTIDAARVAELSPFESSKFQPSAAAIHPILQKLFILSSASHQLVITDLNGKVESVFKLSPKLFPQPEGITFTQTGDMYISNEAKTAKPTLLKFIYDTNSDQIDTVKADYDFSKPDDKMELGNHLHEISGMAYIPGKDLILGENDEKGEIFTFDFKNRNDKMGKVKFGGKGDYEDIVYTDSAVYMLISSGTIVQVKTKDGIVSTKEFTLDEGKNEFETLYLDADRKSLIMLCKECSHEKKNEVRVAYRFDLTTNTFDPSPAYTIDIEEIKRMLGDDQALFKPSAAGINPVNGKLYIVASVGKLLVIADKNTGKPEQVFPLNPAIYNQPEGMTFAPNGDLYISNEGGEGIATVLKFVYKK